MSASKRKSPDTGILHDATNLKRRRKMEKVSLSTPPSKSKVSPRFFAEPTPFALTQQNFAQEALKILQESDRYWEAPTIATSLEMRQAVANARNQLNNFDSMLDWLEGASLAEKVEMGIEYLNFKGISPP